jgi:hypothetical protein
MALSFKDDIKYQHFIPVAEHGSTNIIQLKAKLKLDKLLLK